MRGLSAVGVTVGGTFIAGLLTALALLTALTTSFASQNLPMSVDDVAGFGDFVLVIFVGMGLVLGGHMGASVSGSAGMFSGEGGIGITLFPLLMTLAVLTVTFWWAFRQERTAPLRRFLDRLLHAGIVGLGSSLVVLILTLIFTVRKSPGDGISLSITGAGWQVVVFGTILVGIAALLGRLSAARVPQARTWWQGIYGGVAALPRAVREVVLYTAGLIVVFGITGIIVGIVAAFGDAGPGVLPAVLVGLLNVVGFEVVLGHLGGLQTGFAGFGNSVGTVFNAGGMTWLLVVVAVLYSVFVAVWLGTRRQRVQGIDVRTGWQFPVMVFAGWVIHGLLFFGIVASISGSMGGFGGGGAGGVGLAFWTPFVFLLWAAAIELGAQTLPTVFYGLSPQFHGFLAGRRTQAAWVAGHGAPAWRLGAGAGAAPVPGIATPAAASAAAAPVSPANPAQAADAVAAPLAGDAANVEAPVENATLPLPDASLPGATAAPAGSAPAAPGAPAPLPEPKPLSPKTKKALLWSGIGVAAIAVLAIGGAVAVNVINGTRSPEAVAEKYLSYIAAGNAEAANKMVDPNVREDERTLLTNEVMQSASERISDVKVKAYPDAGGDERPLRVTYRLDGVQQEARLMASKGDPEWLVLDTWQLDDSLTVPVSVNVYGQADITLGGADVPLERDESGYGQAEFSLYPGVYEFGQKEGSDLYEIVDPSAVVGADGLSSSFSLELKPTEAFTKNVQDQVNAIIDKCAKSKDARPEGCPFYTFVYPTDTKVNWKVDEYPTIELNDQGTRFNGDNGQVTATYTRDFLGKKTKEKQERTLYLYGEIEIVDGKPKITLN